ncbi:hypothetical protein OIE75_40880 (plasmid) [Streptomyces sp. NBC_01723]|uniref:hypothetical protein n=1 Tax=Streptomyces sp. NBC_01723 TaxID=2975921 RepID=UPI002E346F1A|nr:hypothetical protein [Streptomyces sp. NBC_01723]
MNRDEPNENDLRLMAFMEQLLGLSDDTDTAGRIILLGPTGEFAGEASLSARDLEIATKALAAARAFTEATKDIELPADAVLDPVVEQDFEEYCIGLDTDYLMDLAAHDPRKAVHAFDLVTEPAPKEQILREDSNDWDGEL